MHLISGLRYSKPIYCYRAARSTSLLRLTRPANTLFSSSFNPEAGIPDLTGRVIAVTGGNTGIGYATVQHLARHGAKVYLGARNESKAKVAIEQLKKEGLGPGNGEIIWLDVDLSDPCKAKAAAQSFIAKEKRLDVLVNNAAMLFSAECKRSYYDVQDNMMVNHISPFVFTQTLIPLMQQTAKQPGSDVRIVIVSSDAIYYMPKGIRYRNREDFNRDFNDMSLALLKRYGLSKLANVLYAKQLQKNLTEEGSPIIVTAVHPGTVNNGSNKNLEISSGNQAYLSSIGVISRTIHQTILNYFLPTSTKGAYTSVFAAASPEVREKAEMYKGAFLVPVAKIGRLSEDAANLELAEELWATTERILAEIGV